MVSEQHVWPLLGTTGNIQRKALHERCDLGHRLRLRIAVSVVPKKPAPEEWGPQEEQGGTVYSLRPQCLDAHQC